MMMMDTVSPTHRWIEVWVSPDSDSPHLLVLRSGPDGDCEVVDPQQGWNRVHNFDSYEAAYYWLRQEIYDLVEGRRTLRR